MIYPQQPEEDPDYLEALKELDEEFVGARMENDIYTAPNTVHVVTCSGIMLHFGGGVCEVSNGV